MSNVSAPSELLSAVDAVAIISNLNPPRSVGALYLQDEEGTRSGKFFFKDGLIYAAKVDGYEFPLAHRAAHSGLIDEEDQRSVLASAGGDPSNPILETLYLQRHLLDQKTVESYLRENFLAVSGTLLTLNPVRAEWRDAETTEDFVVRYIDVPTLVSICAKRASTLQTAAERMGTDVDGLFASPVKMLREVKEEEDNLSVEAIWALHQADEETPLDEAAAKLGFTRLFLAKSIYRMWNSGIIEIMAKNQVQPSPTTPTVATAPAEDSVPLYQSEEPDESSSEEMSVAADLVEEEPSSIALANDYLESEEALSLSVEDTPEITDPFHEQADSYVETHQNDSAEPPAQENLSSEKVELAVDETPIAEEALISVTQNPMVESENQVIDSAPVEPAVITAPDLIAADELDTDMDADFAMLTQAITSMTERARLANVNVQNSARAIEDASAAAHESEEEVAAINQVLARLHEELKAQEDRLVIAETKAAENRRKEEQTRLDAQQAQTQAALLTARLEKLRSAF